MNNYAYVDALFCKVVSRLISNYLKENGREIQGGIQIDYLEKTINWIGPSQWANDFEIDD